MCEPTKNARRGLLLAILLAGLLAGVGPRDTIAQETGAKPQVLARVNGKPITDAQLQFQFFLDQLPEDSEEARKDLLDSLIDRELIRQYLQSRKVTADPTQLEHQVTIIQKLVADRGGEIHDVLGQLHLTPESMKEVLALPLAWKKYVRSVITDSQLRTEWEAHRSELDGSRVKASQIVLLLPQGATPDQWKQAEEQLKQIRSDILAGKMTFAEAAQKYSQSPSGKSGGSLGTFEFRGRVDPKISRVAFQTPPGEISEPFRTATGVHIVQTHEVIPGQLSPEDVRGELLNRLGDQLWDKQVEESRKKARIQLLP